MAGRDANTRDAIGPSEQEAYAQGSVSEPQVRLTLCGSYLGVW